MTADLWNEFVRDAARDRTCGYFESRDPTRSDRGWAFRFSEPDELFVLSKGDGAHTWQSAVARTNRLGSRSALIGYLGFDSVCLFDRLYGPPPGGCPFPLGEFALVRRARLRAVAAPSRRRLRRGARTPGPLPVPREDSLSPRTFQKGVRELRSAIFAGEAYQVVLAHRRRFERPEDLLERARVLRQRERYEFFYYLKFDDHEVVGASPESVVEVAGDRAFINPIAGTRGRPTPPGRLALLHDPKELAEHRMLVDLARNDLGRVARPGSVKLLVKERREQYARLEHLVSRVGCRLAPGRGPADVLPAAFPAGTVTGAPKIRATRLLRRVEGTWRGPYGGAVGAVLGNGNASFALAIRSAFTSRDSLFTSAGAGIVAGSEPVREHAETLTKLEEIEATLVGGDRR